jgi:membrane protease YdiL (CAAX protease family)
MDEPASLSSFLLFSATAATSFTAIFYLFQRHISGSPLLAYEPRRRVPWGQGLALVAILIPLTSVASSIINSLASPADATVVEVAEEILKQDEPKPANNPDTFVQNGLVVCALMLTFVLIVGWVIHDFLGADANDFGLPMSSTQFVADIGLGVFACVASMLPIYAIQLVLTYLLVPENEHPLVDELKKTHTPAMMLVGVLMVVVAAPLFEEFSFRLLLQGWLEKWEDEQIGYSGTIRPLMSDNISAESELDEQDAEEGVILPLPRVSVPLPRSGLLPDLPYGWLPILISAILFGLAHWGHGVSPVPLVLFGIVLGYLYQRTHRLVPSITAHAVFNSYSMIMLWLSF